MLPQATAILSVPVLDVVLLVSLVTPLTRYFLRCNLIFVESYKTARLLSQALLQSLPMAVLAALLLAMWHQPAVAAALAPQQGLLIACLALALVNLVQKVVQLAWEARMAGSSAWRHLARVVQLQGACRLPAPVVEDALAAMRTQEGSCLRFSNVWCASDALYEGAPHGGRLPLVPRWVVCAKSGVGGGGGWQPARWHKLGCSRASQRAPPSLYLARALPTPCTAPGTSSPPTRAG